MLCQMHPTIETAYQLAQDFLSMLVSHQAELLDTWLATVENCGVAAFERLGRGIEQDYAAVLDGLTLWGSRGPGEPIKADQENDVWPRSFPSASSASSEGSLGARFLASPIFLGKYLFQGSIRIEIGIWRKVKEKEVQTLFGESDCLPHDMGW